VRFAYADPPYLGQAVKLYGDHPDAAVYDSLDGHRKLIERLVAEFPDGWALSLSAASLTAIASIAPDGHRWGAWHKTFAFWKINVNPAFTWEPVMFLAGRPRGRERRTITDSIATPVTYQRGVKGAKPFRFCFWVFEMLGALPADDLVDVFPGSGAVARAWDAWRLQGDLLDVEHRNRNASVVIGRRARAAARPQLEAQP
jgi:hypothetical protein